MPVTTIVAAGIIRKDGKFLIAKRSSASSSEPGRWEFPGGKVEFLEDPKDALIREIKEELGVRIHCLDIFDVVSVASAENVKYPHVIIIAYLADWAGGELCLNGCEDVKFVTMAEIDGFDLIEADRKIAKSLLVRSNEGRL